MSISAKYAASLCLIVVLCFTACRPAETRLPDQEMGSPGADKLETQSAIALGQEFTLQPGQTVVVGDDLKLTFEGVVEDSRCPSKVTCVWMGRAVLSFAGQKGEQKSATFNLITIHSPDKTDRILFEGYEIWLKAIEPYPELPDQPIPAEAYRATLLVEQPTADACPPRPDDSTGYLVTICRYIQEKGLNVDPANPAEYQIKRIEEGTENGRAVVWVFLNCCYLGDIAIIDKDTGQVIDFRVGAK
jgi:hypothetical protein